MTRHATDRDIAALAHTGSGAAVSRITMATAKRPTSEEAVAPLVEVMAELVRTIWTSIESCSMCFAMSALFVPAEQASPIVPATRQRAVDEAVYSIRVY